MAREKSRENAIKAYLRSQRAYVLKVHGSALMPKGTPDLIVCYRGHFFAFEVKNDVGRPSDYQLRVIRIITKAGGTAAIVRTVDEVREIISAYED